MSKENKAFVRTFLDAFAGGDVETTKAMMADDHVFHFPFVDEPMDKETLTPPRKQGLLPLLPT